MRRKTVRDKRRVVIQKFPEAGGIFAPQHAWQGAGRRPSRLHPLPLPPSGMSGLPRPDTDGQGLHPMHPHFLAAA